MGSGRAWCVYSIAHTGPPTSETTWRSRGASKVLSSSFTSSSSYSSSDLNLTSKKTFTFPLLLFLDEKTLLDGLAEERAPRPPLKAKIDAKMDKENGLFSSSRSRFLSFWIFNKAQFFSLFSFLFFLQTNRKSGRRRGRRSSKQRSPA
jgi:hypothetical protein